MQVRLFPSPAGLPSGSEHTASAPSAIIETHGEESLSRALWLSGQLNPLPLCGGLGRCGRCRVRFMGHAPTPLPEELTVFTEQETADGWRLACRRQVSDGVKRGPDPAADETCDLELPVENFVCSTDSATTLPAPEGLPDLALAVDLGTTSLYWRALSLGGVLQAQGHCLNPQAGAGPDIVSRLAVAQKPQGRRLLAHLVRNALRQVMGRLAENGLGRVVRICLAGNTAMTDIFLDREIKGLCAAPYTLSHGGNETVLLTDFPPVYIPPLPAPFVGGDVSAGLAALIAADIPRPFVLADLGTNGEVALLTETGRLWLTSVPLGPALEGIGPECGKLAGPGVVTGFRLTAQGLDVRFFDGQPSLASPHSAHCSCPLCLRAAQGENNAAPHAEAPALGISATGYISLLAVLLRMGLMREDGHFVSDPPMPLARRMAALLAPGETLRGGTRLRLPHGLWLAAADVEELLKVKAAFALALECLLRAAGLAPADIATLCLAGALGEHVAPDDLETLGFIPAALARRTRAVGNSSLDGASLLVLHESKGRSLARMCAGAHVLSLVQDPSFHNDYLRHMRFGV